MGVLPFVQPSIHSASTFASVVFCDIRLRYSRQMTAGKVQKLQTSNIYCRRDPVVDAAVPFFSSLISFFFHNNSFVFACSLDLQQRFCLQSVLGCHSVSLFFSLSASRSTFLFNFFIRSVSCSFQYYFSVCVRCCLCALADIVVYSSSFQIKFSH